MPYKTLGTYDKYGYNKPSNNSEKQYIEEKFVSIYNAVRCTSCNPTK